jgi:hypothetical protein
MHHKPFAAAMRGRLHRQILSNSECCSFSLNISAADPILLVKQFGASQESSGEAPSRDRLDRKPAERE